VHGAVKILDFKYEKFCNIMDRGIRERDKSGRFKKKKGIKKPDNK
jgi:hypothetical protein